MAKPSRRRSAAPGAGGRSNAAPAARAGKPERGASGRAPDRNAPRERPESPATRRLASRAAWAAIAILAATLLCIALGPHRIGAFDVETDFYGGYAPAAISIQQGRILGADGRIPAVFGFVGPLYPALLALGGFVLRDMFTAAELMSVTASVLIVVFWFLMLRRRANAALGLVVVLLLAANPILVRYGYAAATDMTAIAFQSAAIYLLFAGTSRAAAAGAGACVALAALTRYTSVYLVPAGLIAIATKATLHPRRREAAALFGVTFLALTLPWQIYARLHGAEVQFHQLLAYDVYARARNISWDTFLADIWPRFEHSPLAVLTAEPKAVAQRLFFNLADHASQDAKVLLGVPVAALAAIAALTAWIAILFKRSHPFSELAPLVFLWAWAYLALVPAPSSERYSLAVLPFYMLLAGATITWAVRRPLRGGHRIVAGLALAVSGAVIAQSGYASFIKQTRTLEQQPLETLECAETLRALARPGDRVMARKPNLAFHAGVGSAPFPFTDSLEVLAREARAQRARWLYVSVSEVQLRPATAFLLDTTAVVPGLTLRDYVAVPITVEGHRWHRDAALYEIGPEFGVRPAWFSSDTLWVLHTLRGRGAFPNGNDLIKLARVELAIGNRAGVRAAWIAASEVDPVLTSGLMNRFRGDTIACVLEAMKLIQGSAGGPGGKW